MNKKYLFITSILLLFLTSCSFTNTNVKDKQTDKRQNKTLKDAAKNADNKNKLTLEEKREEKLNQLVIALKKKDANSLSKLLSDYKKTPVSKAKDILDKMSTYWGDISLSKKVNINCRAKKFKNHPFCIKGNEHIRVNLRFDYTNFSKGVYFKDDNFPYLLRVLILFKKGSSKIGGFILYTVNTQQN